METTRGVPNLLADGFVVVAVVLFVAAAGDATEAVQLPFSAGVYLVFAAVSVSLAWILRRLT